ncbi:hypothetical protein ACUXST_001193 [Sphingomonas sp. F9_3S_D5_B_2]
MARSIIAAEMKTLLASTTVRAASAATVRYYYTGEAPTS